MMRETFSRQAAREACYEHACMNTKFFFFHFQHNSMSDTFLLALLTEPIA